MFFKCLSKPNYRLYSSRWSYGKNSLICLVKFNSQETRRNNHLARFQTTRASSEKNLRGIPIGTPKTTSLRWAQRVNPPTLPHNLIEYKKHVDSQKDEKGRIPIDVSHHQAHAEQRAKFIPEHRSMGAGALGAVLFNMFGKPTEPPAFLNNTDHVSTTSRTLTENSFGGFTPPKNVFPQDSPASMPSPELQIIQKLHKIQQLQKRSFSTTSIKPVTNTGDSSSDPYPRSPAMFNRITNGWTQFRFRMAPRRPRPDNRQRKHVQHVTTPLEPSKEQLTRGFPLVSASGISLSRDLKKIVEQSQSDSSSGPDGLEARPTGSTPIMTLQPSPGFPCKENSSEPFTRNVMSVAVKDQSSLLKLLHQLMVTIPQTTGTVRSSPSVEAEYKTFIAKRNRSDVNAKPVSGLLPHSPLSEGVLTDVVSTKEQPPIARLAHGLDRVLFNQSIHWLQDPHSKVFNFSPDLQTVPSVTDFAFERLPKYKHSSEDDRMLELAVHHAKPFIGSTSTLTKILSHIYFLLSENRLVDISTLSMAYADQSRRFTPGMRAPAYFTLRRRLLPKESNDLHCVHAVDTSRPAQEHPVEWNVLLWLGTMMEKFLTYPKEQFDNLRRDNVTPLLPPDKSETYRYAKSAKFIMRSQLDCQDSRLPGTGVFDLKSRAVLPIRIDQLNIREHSGYMIHQTTGLLESFEREYYDLIRSAFLKYNFQARIGNMDGIFVAYHNTARLFGFQYIPVREMEERLYGPGPPDRGPRIFEKCIRLMETLMEQIIGCFPGHSLSCTVETQEGANELVVWVVPVDHHSFPIPIEEFAVTVQHMVNDSPVSGKVAIERAHQNWSVQYFITRREKSEAEKWESLKKCQRRAEFGVVLPEGVSADLVRAQLGSVDWAAGLGFDWDPKNNVSVRRDDEELTYQKTTADREVAGLKLTTKSYGLITKLRKMAKGGKRKKTDLLKSPGSDKPSIMWGRDPDIVDDESSSQNNSIVESKTKGVPNTTSIDEPRTSPQGDFTGNRVISDSFYRP